MKYQELGELGRGGMAVVYRARTDGQAEAVALKRPLPWPTCDERLTREISVLTALSHPHVMPVLDHGVDDEGKPWYVMPIARASLAALWEQGQLGDEAEELCTELLEEVGAGLDAMHAARLVHRDVTPRNIMALDDPAAPRGFRWVVSDCGLVRRPLGETTLGLTGSATSLGSPGYIAPEALGAPHELTTSASDIYSLGRIFAWLLTGEKPQWTAPLLPSGPWRALVRAMTREDPVQRPQSIEETQALASDTLAALPVSERADFRGKIAERGGSLQFDNPLWQVALDHLNNYSFMIDDLVNIKRDAARRFATHRPDEAAKLGERLGRHLCDGDHGNRQWDSFNARLAWIRAVLEGLAEKNRDDLFEDVAVAYCEAVAQWDRYPENDALRPWLAGLRGRIAEAMARAIRQAGATDYFKAMTEGRTFTSPALQGLLGD